MIPQRKKRNSSKINLVISIVFHALLVLASVFLAAREGMLGGGLKKIAIIVVPKEKPPEKAKPKEPEQKAKVEPKAAPKIAAVKAATPPPPPPKFVAPDAVAPPPPPPSLPTFDFAVQKEGPIEQYKSLLESTIRQRWVRPDNLADKDFVAEIELAIDNTGRITGNDWKKGSGNKKWDESVRQTMAQIKSLNRPPPPSFPSKFVVRFDVQLENEPLLSASN